MNNIKIKKIVLDPVMVAKGGTELINSKAIYLLGLNNKAMLCMLPNLPMTH